MVFITIIIQDKNKTKKKQRELSALPSKNIKKNEKQDRIFVIGATGKIGSAVVQELLRNDAQITIYARSREKVIKQLSLMSTNNNYDKIKNKATIVQGGFDNLIPFENSITGHTRMFLLIADIPKQRETLITISEIAYAAGVK